MAPLRLPTTCRVLVVEKEPVQALALEYVLEDIGCRAVGPVWQADDVLRSVRRGAPNLALVDSNLQGHLLPAVACLNRFRVPIAFLTMGGESDALDRVRDLRARPRVDRPFHAPTVFRTALELYRQDLEDKIARADQRIAEGRRRLGDQLRRMERSGAAPRPGTLDRRRSWRARSRAGCGPCAPAERFWRSNWRP
jgi:CheY-like chemotaxis protein